MTTSGVYTLTMTARDVVIQAMRELRILAGGEEPEAAEMADGITALNGMLKSWQLKDSLWREEQVELIVDAGDGAPTLDADIRNVTDVRLQMTATYQQPMQMWERADYMQVPNKLVTGVPLCFYFSRQRDAATLFLWPVPSAETTLLLDTIRGIQTVTGEAQTLDVPEDWLEAVWTNLAVRLAGSYSSAILTDELIARSQSTYQELLDDDRPESYFMGPWDDRYYG